MGRLIPYFSCGLITLKKLVSILLTLLLLISSDLIGQDIQQVSIEELIKGKPLSILDEKIEINVYGKEYFPQSFKFRREVTYKILNQRGIPLLKKQLLPGNFDPTYIPHGPRVKKLGVYYSGYDIEDFDVSIVRKGKLFKPKIKKKIVSVESFNIDYLYEYQQHVYHIDGMEVGDEVKIVYNLDIPFSENYSRFASFRIFFHDSIPKIKYELSISHHKSLDIQLFGFNGAEDRYTVEREKIRYHIWKYTNLSGCINEERSRAYNELPYITWIINHYKYYVHNTNQLLNVPHYAVIASLRSPKLPDIIHAIEIGRTNSEFIPFYRTYDRLTKGLTPDFQRIKFLHNHIAEKFTYQNDLDYYRREDLRGDRLGEFFSNGILRDHNRYDLYYALLIKSEDQFYTSFLIDKRFGEISDEYFQPNFDSDFLLANYFGEQLLDFMYPKSGSFGWYYNELPFYWQNCLTRLVHISDYASYKYPVKELFRSVTTPENRPEHNRRSVTAKVRIDLDYDSIYFDTRLSLSGQYSTLCRPTYLNKTGDLSVDKRYRMPVWSVDGLQRHSSNASVLSQAPPFVSEFDCKYVVSTPLNLDGSDVTLSLISWIGHMLPTPQLHGRYLKYYPDFMGKDEYKYQIQFARPVVLKNAIVKKVDNDYGSYIGEIKQLSPNVIRVISSFQVRTTLVEAADFNQVMEIKKAVNAISEVVLGIP